MEIDGWSELAATNAPVEDEPVQPVLRMNILLVGGVFFFFTSSLPHLPPPSYPPSYLPNPTYHLPPPYEPHPPLHSIARARVVERKLELWSCCCGVRAGARAPTRPTCPRSGKMLTFLFYFCVCFVWRGIAALRCNFSFFFFLFFFVFFFFSFFFVFFFFFSFFFFRKEGDGSAFYFLCWAAAQL